MTDQTKRGGLKQGPTGEPRDKHQGVRPGSTGTAKERGNEQAREPVVPKKDEYEAEKA